VRFPIITVCSEDSKYFDTLDVRCHDCGDATARGMAAFSTVVAIFIVLVGGVAFLHRIGLKFAASAMYQLIQKAHAIWHFSGGRFKVKAIVGFFQSLAAVPNVYNVVTPNGMEAYIGWVRLLELPNLFGVSALIPQACFGSYKARLLIGCLWPVVLLAAYAMVRVCWEIAQDRLRGRILVVGTRGTRAARRNGLVTQGLPLSFFVFQGLSEAMPAVLVLTFLLVPSASTQIFMTYNCNPVEYDHSTGDVRRYLHDDLSLSCTTDEYRDLENIANVMKFLWPIGVPVLYGVLLWLCRHELRTGTAGDTKLGRAIALLWADCTSAGTRTAVFTLGSD
jgi:hypothetical protein